MVQKQGKKIHPDNSAIWLVIFITLIMFSACMMPMPDEGGEPASENENPEDEGEKREGFNSNLPLVIINLWGGKIVKEPKIPAYMKIINNEWDRNYTCDMPRFEGRIGIEIRGSSSAGFPKKSYGFETWDGNDEDIDVSLLGFPAESDWILYGPYSDKSLIRNHLAFTLTRQTGCYASRTKFVELLFEEDDDYAYQGIYILMEKIKRNRYRVDISRLEASHNSEPEISGGYILKIDRRNNDDAFRTDRNIEIVYVYPKTQFITEFQKTWIRDYINTFEASLFTDDFAHPVRGYAPYINTASFIDYILLREFFRDVDTYVLSTFMHKDRGGKLRMGPVWDFNLSMGNSNFGYRGKTEGWELVRRSGDPRACWFRRLLRDDSFKNRLIRRWGELRQDILSMKNIFSLIDDSIYLLDEARQRNFERWPILGQYVWPNPEPVAQTYEEEIDQLKTWLEQRAAWMDANIHTIH